MKVFLNASSKSLNSIIDSSFSRSNYFLLYETDNDEYEFFNNIHQDLQSSVGMAVANLAIEKGAEVVIAVNPGPHAFKTLKENNIAVYHAPEGKKLKEIIKMFINDQSATIDNFLPHYNQ